MSSLIKQKLARNIYDAIHNKFYTGRFEDVFGWFKLIKSNDNKLVWRIHMPVKSSQTPDSALILNSQSELLESKVITQINTADFGKACQVELDLKHLMKDVLNSNPVLLNYKPYKQKLIVEFSSPNIAKPFHVGHLRSTIIGNCIGNIKSKLGKDVVKMNYLGDWGTQFGLIQVGVNLENYSEEDLQSDPIKKMYSAYVRGNREAEVNSEIYEKAKKIFADLESGEESITQMWSKYKNWTIEELSRTYKRLGVVFDKYEWESDYRRNEADGILDMLKEKGLLTKDEKGRLVATLGENIVPLLKSDNTTLYLLRDLMAVSNRRSKEKFDEMYYVVENGQCRHFEFLFTLCKELKFDEGVSLRHVKFGRIHGMSSRKGKVTFLSDILEEAQERCYQSQVKSKNTKVSLDSRNVADILGVSGVVVNDLKQHRKKDYEFSWENCLQLKGDGGIKLQYCHCRLCSLEANSNVSPASDCDPDALLEPEAIDLVLEIARFEEVLWQANNQLEPCILVSYLFRLVKAVNAAFLVLTVKNTEEHVASQRLLLFFKSREVLSEGMKLLGLQPLLQM